MFSLAQSLVYGLGAVLAAAAIAIITAWLQHRNWRHQQDVSTRKILVEEALSLTKDLSSLCNRRIYRQRQYLWKVRSGPSAALDVAREEYRKSLFDWNDNLGQIKAGIYVYFGINLMNKIEEDIHDRLKINGESIEKADRSSSNKSLSTEERQLDSISYELYEISSTMLKRIKSEDIAEIQDKKIISHGNREHISIYRLLSRLVNISH